MAITTKLYLVRHGESVLNKQRVISGQLNPSLTDKGREEAREAKAKIDNIHFDTVYSSDLDRAVETAEIIYGQPVPLNHRLTNLREQYLGSLQGKPIKDLQEDDKKKRNMSSEESWLFKYTPEMESDDELANRFIQALDSIAKNNLDKTILVVAHGGPIRATLRRLQNISYSELPLNSFKNAGYAELIYQDNYFKVVRVIGVQI